MLRLSIPQLPYGGCAIQQQFDASTHHTKRHGHRKSNRNYPPGNGYNGSFAHLLSLFHFVIEAFHKWRTYRTDECLPIVQRCCCHLITDNRGETELSRIVFAGDCVEPKREAEADH